MFSDLLFRLRALIRKRSVEIELDDELMAHVDRQSEKYARAGIPRDEALRRARMDLGGLDQVKEECRDARGVNFVESTLKDIQYGARMLRKSSGFTAIAVLTLALGIGANTAIFSVIDAVLLRPLPYAQPDQLVRVFETKTQKGATSNGASYLNIEEWRRQNHVFSELGEYQVHELTMTGRGDPTTVRTVVVTPELFSLIDAKPLAGRIFMADDDKKGAAPVVILGEDLWRGRMGGDPNIVGTTINLDMRSFTVIGVMPASFRFPLLGQGENIWIPLVQDPLFGGAMEQRAGHLMNVFGRLRPGVTMAQAQAEMDAINARLIREFPADNAGWTIRMIPLRTAIVGNVTTALLVLMGAVGLVLLIACVNIANLLLTRATARAREIAVRYALGAGRGRIVRQLLTESILLGVLGGVGGLLLAYWGVRSLTTLLPPALPQIHPIGVDGWVAGFALLVSGITGLISGMAPAFFGANSRLHATLKESGRSVGGGHHFLRKILAVSEISLAMILLVGAGLLIRSFAALTSVNPGFEADHLLKAEISLPRFQYSTPQQWAAFSDKLLARIQAQPGLTDSAAAVPLPLAYDFISLSFQIEGNPPLPPGAVQTADFTSVSPNYFKVMGIPLIRGRHFVQQDAMAKPLVTVISEALARQYFPNQDPIGKHLVFGFPPDGGASREIVGVVGDVRDESLGRAPRPMMYAPFGQSPFWGFILVVKTPLSPESAASAIRQEVHNIDKDLPVADVALMSDVIQASVAQPRFRTLLISLFGAMALTLAAVGIFGTISYSVACRTHEFGIRMALGAKRSDVLRLVAGQGLKLALIGVGSGIVGALVLTRFLSSLLYNVRTTDPMTFIAVSLLLIVVATLAGYIPARRATQVDPVVALRHE